MYQGTSLWLWVVQGVIAISVVAFVIAIGLVLLLVAAFLLVAGVVAFLAWWGWLEVKDRWLDPPERVERPRSIGGAPRTKGLMNPRAPGARPEDRS